MKSKFLKYVSVLCVIVIIASSSLFSVDAYVYDNVIDDYNQLFGESIVDNVEMMIYDVSTGTGSYVAFEEADVFETSNGRGVQIKLTHDGKFSINKNYLIFVSLRIESERFLNSNNYVKGSYSVGFSSDRFMTVKNGTGQSFDALSYCYRENSNNKAYQQFGTISYSNTQYTYYAHCNFPANEIGETFNYYHTTLYVDPTIDNFYKFSVFLYDWNFEVYSQDEKNTQAIIDNQNQNTDKILDAGSETPMPDFDSLNSDIDKTTSDINAIEGSYNIDDTDAKVVLQQGKSFFDGDSLQSASIHVKGFIERFTEDNVAMKMFFISAMCLGLCFWVIGRKSFK